MSVDGGLVAKPVAPKPRLGRDEGDSGRAAASRASSVPWRRSRFLRAFLRALGDRATYRVHANAGLWLGFLLALPIPVLSLASESPAWIDAIAFTAPFVWAAILGAAGRVAGLGDDALRRVTEAASTAGRAHDDAIDRITSDATDASRAHAAERVTWRSAVQSERSERERLEALQRLMDQELDLAQRVNRSLVPEDVVRPDLEVVVRQIPCSYVGGDYLHVALPRPDLLYLCVGDVSGHGVSAALVVSRIHELVERWILEQRPPEQVLEHLDRASVRILEHTPIFVTFAVFRVDLAARRIEYATAGHPAQLLFRTGGAVESLRTENGLLGSSYPDVVGPWVRGSVAYAEGDTLVLFTDGLFEVAARAGGEMLGESGLLSSLGDVAGSAPERVASEILRRVADYGKVGPFEDDVSLMVARLGRPAATRDAGSGGGGRPVR